MNQQALYQLLFNAVGVLIGLLLVGYIGYTLVHTDTEPPCSERYPAPTVFALESASGTLLSPIELQARVGLREWGVVDNAEVIPGEDGEADPALEVKLANLPDVETGGGRPANGVEFRWNPPGLRPATAGCLTYKIWLPQDFAFNGGGVLPGIFGGLSPAAAAEAEDEVRFASRLQWDTLGEGELAVMAGGAEFHSINQRGEKLPKGKWTSIEQEIVLNVPGEANGIARMWIDGRLTAEDTRLRLRHEDTSQISGVLAGIGYLRASKKPGVLRLSPLALAWR